ncbi:MAG: hypothetical protein GX483_06215 [Actinomycetaceae bacterium]|nr:hypothetical protein [Actinomycetaceae bacterium]
MTKTAEAFAVLATFFIMLVVGWIVVVPGLRSIFFPEWPDSGSRPLIIFATQGGDRNYDTHVISTVDVHGDLTLIVYLVESAESEPNSYFGVDYELVIASNVALSGLTCNGEAKELEEIDATELSPGPAYAYTVDEVSNLTSATNFSVEESDESDAVSPSVARENGDEVEDNNDEKNAYFYRHTGVFGVWNIEDVFSRRGFLENDHGTVWVEECHIPSSAIWSYTESGVPFFLEPKATLFLPQFNLTSINNTTDHQSDLRVTVNVDRPPNLKIAEAFPHPKPTATGWTHYHTVYWFGKLGEFESFAWTDQPTWMLVDREGEKKEEFFLLLAGVYLGLIFSVMHFALKSMLYLFGRSK